MVRILFCEGVCAKTHQVTSPVKYLLNDTTATINVPYCQRPGTVPKLLLVSVTAEPITVRDRLLFLPPPKGVVAIPLQSKSYGSASYFFFRKDLCS